MWKNPDIAFLYQLFRQSKGISIDTRSLQQGEIFIAISGENFNANTFASQALEKGAAYAIVEDAAYSQHEKCILVNDTLEYLQNLARYHRQQFDIPIIGITGSNGKTTTKELLAGVLSQHYRVHFTQGNLNNHIGVPLSLLRMPQNTEIAVIEMGANHLGEIAMLCNIAQPTHGLITSIGKAHLEGFGSLEGVQQGKGELFHYLAQHQGTAFVFADDPKISAISPQNIPCITYGSHASCHVFASVADSKDFLHIKWHLSPQNEVNISTYLLGLQHFGNVLAAIAVGNFFGLNTTNIAQGVAAYIPQNNRSEVHQWEGKTIVLDAYNANPNSMAAALHSLAKSDIRPRIAVLGDMAELGEYAPKEHQAILDLAQNLSIEHIILVGENFSALATTYPHFENSTEAGIWLKTQNFSEGIILIKASRSVKMEKVWEILQT